jgi:hypothetical protein
MVSVGLQVRHPTRLIHPAAKDMIARLAPPASDASVDPDAVRLAADLPAQCPEAVRGSRPSASADAPEPQVVRTRQALPLLDALPMVVCPCLAQDVAQQFPPSVVPEHRLEQRLLGRKLESQAVQPVPQDESASPQVRSREARSEQPSSQEPLHLQEEPQPRVPPGAVQPAEPVSLPRALPFQPKPPAPQVPQASVAQPQAL